MAFEHIIQPLLDAGMIRRRSSSRNYDVYDYTDRAMNKVYNTCDDDDLSWIDAWHFANIGKLENPQTINVWLPQVITTTPVGTRYGGFRDTANYKYDYVKDIPEQLYGTRFEERVKILFEGLGVPYAGNDDSYGYIDLDDIII